MLVTTWHLIGKIDKHMSEVSWLSAISRGVGFPSVTDSDSEYLGAVGEFAPFALNHTRARPQQTSIGLSS